MLTADLVSVRRRGDELRIEALDDRLRPRAEQLAALLLEIARGHIGRSRDELDAAWAEVAVPTNERRLRAALLKMVEDRCTFESASPVDPVELRRELFVAAAAARRAGDGAFDRDALVAEVAAARGAETGDVERWLFSDLRGAETLGAFDGVTPAALVAGFDLAQIQAVLLRATAVTAKVRAGAPGVYRDLFRKLKFLRLLHSIERGAHDDYTLRIDGPMSLFSSATRYGLQLALALPAIVACDRWTIDADVLWGKERRSLRFRARGQAETNRPPTGATELVLPDEVRSLLAQLREMPPENAGGWSAEAADVVLDVPGAGVCVPDLVFRAPDRGPVYLEALGFWSREAVWRRVELVERGLAAPVVFAVSKHLRVSEAALPDECPAALYVYARAMSAQGVLRAVERVARKVVTPAS